MEPKLTILFLLIGTIVGFSHLDGASLAQPIRQLVRRDWRDFLPHWRRR